MSMILPADPEDVRKWDDESLRSYIYEYQVGISEAEPRFGKPTHKRRCYDVARNQLKINRQKEVNHDLELDEEKAESPRTSEEEIETLRGVIEYSKQLIEALKIQIDHLDMFLK